MKGKLKNIYKNKTNLEKHYLSGQILKTRNM